MGQMPMKGSNAPWPQRILYGFAARCRNGRDRSVATAEIVQRAIRSTFPNCEAQSWHLSSKFSASHCIRVSCAVCLGVNMDDDWSLVPGNLQSLVRCIHLVIGMQFSSRRTTPITSITHTSAPSQPYTEIQRRLSHR